MIDRYHPGGFAHALERLRPYRYLVWLLPICLLALTVRLWAVYEYLPPCDPAASAQPQCFALAGGNGYLEQQGALLGESGSFTSPGQSDGGTGYAPGARYLPLFPAVLGATQWLGYKDVNAHRVAIAVGLGTGGVFLIGVAARVLARTKRDRAMAIAALLAAVWPPFWANDANLQVEALLVPLCALALIVTQRALCGPTSRRMVALGATAAALALTRLDGLTIGLALIVIVAARVWREADRRTALRRGGLALAVMAVALTPWIAYNLSRFSRPVTLTTGASVAMLAGSCEEATQGEAIGSWALSCLPQRWTAAEEDDSLAARNAAWDNLTSEPLRLPIVAGARVGRLWGLFAPIDTAERDNALEGRGTSAAFVGFLGIYVLAVGAVAGAVHLRRNHVSIAPLMTLIIVPTVAAAGTFAVVRVRAPADVALIALAAVGIAAVTRRVTIFPVVDTTASDDRSTIEQVEAVEEEVGAVIPTAADTPVQVGRYTKVGRRLRPFLPILIIAFAAFGVRLFATYQVRPMCTTERIAEMGKGSCFELTGDPFHYLAVGLSVGLGKGFTVVNAQTAAHPPAFYLEVGAFERLGLRSYDAKRAGFCVVGVLGVALVGLLAFRLGGRRGPLTGAIAAGLAAFNPMFVINDAYGKAESLYLVAVMLALLAAYRMLRRPTIANSALLGLAAGFAWLTRTEAALFLPLVIVAYVIWNRASPIRRRFALAGIAMAVAVLVVTPWLALNRVRFDEPVLFTTNVGQTMVLGGCDDVFYGELIGWYTFQCFDQTRYWGRESEPVADRMLREEAFSYFGEHRSQIPVVLAARLGRMWHLYRPIQTIRLDAFAEARSYGLVLSTYLCWITLVPFAIFGMWRGRRTFSLAPLIATFIMVSLVAMLAAPQLRFRVPADAVIIVTASLGLVALASGREPGRVDNGGSSDPSDPGRR